MGRRMRRMFYPLNALLVLLVALGSRGANAQPKAEANVSADQVQVDLKVKPNDPADPKTKGDAPQIEATIIGAPNLPTDKFTLVEPTSKLPFALKATGRREYVQGTETLALALVINGQEIWIGNDDIEPEMGDDGKANPARHNGILKDLKKALQTVPFSTAGPQGSKGVLITYADKPEVKVPMGALSNLTAEALGSQKDYYQKIGTEMVAGIRLAHAELKSVTAARKAMIIVGDGNDTNPDGAKAVLTQLKKEIGKDGIEVFAIIWKGDLSEPNNVITALDPRAQSVNNADGIGAAITSILKRMADRFYLTFPGYDKKLNVGLLWDGKSHDLVLKIDKEETSPVSLTLSPIWSPPGGGGSLWWLAIVIPLVAILFIVVMVKIFSKKEVPAPVIAAPVAAPVEAPKPAGPMKTVMIGAGGDQDGFPIVGWLVPLNGQNAYQTFRLRSGSTKIGTAAPADIVVNDGFMSTEHCQINCSPAGFSLVDPGSTNGCYVNERKVTKHDLVDNDMITLGKTNFKFKSIN